MNINLYCEGASIAENSLRNFVLLYYPCESFSEKAKNDSEELSVRLVRLCDGTLSAECTLSTAKGTAFAAEYERDISQSFAGIPMEKIIVGRAFLHCAAEIFGYLPPFGILTGVRPAKLALPYLSISDKEGLLDKLLCEVCLASKEKASLVTRIAKKELETAKCLPARSASLYVSVPFCPTRCRYCSFVSYSTNRLLSMIPDYIERVTAEMKALGDIVSGLSIPIKTVYFGGGTPSILTPTLSERLLSAVNESFDLSGISEFTYEAGRPDTVTKEKLEVLKKYGVDRISVNTQTTNDSVLLNIGRNHSYSDYLSALSLAREVGFRTINTDLISGLPGETAESTRKSVDDIISLSPENITVHSFSIKRSSEFKYEGTRDFGDSMLSVRKTLDYAENALSVAGYDPYYIYRQKNTVGNLENVGFTKPGHEGLYNICMMEELHSIFSVGAGAVTKLVSRDGKTIKRLFNHKYPYEYMADENFMPDREGIEKFYRESY